jgi:hypothetical protein
MTPSTAIPTRSLNPSIQIRAFELARLRHFQFSKRVQFSVPVYAGRLPASTDRVALPVGRRMRMRLSTRPGWAGLREPGPSARETGRSPRPWWVG